RFLRRLNPTLRNADNYVESRVEELGPTSCEVWFNEVMEQPAYHQGLLEALVALAGGRDARTRLLACEGPGARFLVEWEAPETR
ncbi:MAG TPA: TIGR02265 family protein, partial [Cystobacter sp.]